MATRTRDTVVGTGRDKTRRGTSPSSNPPRTQQQSRPSPGPSSSKPISANDSEHKHNIPNYLKPTISSGIDVSKQQPVSGKKPAFSTVKQPTLTRRRSFDKPVPPASRMEKARVSPNPTLRSSSFSGGKTIQKTHQRTAPMDATGSMKQSLRPAAAGASSTSHIKKSTTTYVPKKKVDTHDHHDLISVRDQKVDTHDHHDLISVRDQKVDTIIADATDVVDEPDEKQPHQEIHEPPNVTEPEEQMVQLGSNYTEKGVEDSKPEDIHESSVLNVTAQTDEEAGEDVDDKEEAPGKNVIEVEPSKQHNDDSDAAKTTDEPAIEDTPQIELEERNMNEKSNFTDVGSNVPSAEELKKIKEGDKGVAEEEAAACKSEALEDLKETSEATTEGKKEADMAAPPQKQHVNVTVHGKKLDSAVSNDVIEETASKLREQRKNKVKALAGAFETVISLQEPK